MNWLLIAALLAGPRVHSGPAPTIPTLTDDELRDKIDAYLGTIDTPIPEDHWRALGPRAAAVLQPIPPQPKPMPPRRAPGLSRPVSTPPLPAAPRGAQPARRSRHAT